jgi:hypothetical protein
MTNKTSHPATLSESLLVLRGWGDNKARLRVAVQSPEMWFASFCTVKSVEVDRVEFWLQPDTDAVGFLLADCRFEFGDVPPTDADSFLPVGGQVESGIVGRRPDFTITILLLKG